MMLCSNVQRGDTYQHAEHYVVTARGLDGGWDQTFASKLTSHIPRASVVMRTVRRCLRMVLPWRVLAGVMYYVSALQWCTSIHV